MSLKGTCCWVKNVGVYGFGTVVEETEERTAAAPMVIAIVEIAPWGLD